MKSQRKESKWILKYPNLLETIREIKSITQNMESSHLKNKRNKLNKLILDKVRSCLKDYLSSNKELVKVKVKDSKVNPSPNNLKEDKVVKVETKKNKMMMKTQP